MYIIWYVLPRIILAILLFIDVFYFHQLKYVYKFAFLTLFIFLCYYLIYCIRIKITEYIEYLEKYFKIEIISKDYEGSNYYFNIEDIRWDSDNVYEEPEHYITVSRFVHLQVGALWGNYKSYEYTSVPNLETDLDSNKIYDYIQLKKEFNYLLPRIITLQLFIDTYDSMLEIITKISNRKTYINNLRMILKGLLSLITGIYLICWNYILFLTLSVFDINEIMLIFVPPDNPFICC